MGIVAKPDCVIFAAGDCLPKAQVMPYLSEKPYIITADAGYRYAQEIGCMPHLILGDFDSGACPTTEIETLCLNPIKDDTDSAVALKEAVRRGYKQIVLFGGTGSRLDHTFANFDLCAYAKTQGVDFTVADAHHRVFALQNETQILPRDDSKYISIFAFGGACTVTLKGFYYPLEHYTFTPFCGMGVSNEITAQTAEITVYDGTALVFITDKD
ncbi:MAG: thiamine diphosphokinase [Candidatus Fimenecus sp.]